MQFEKFDKKIREAADHHHPAYDDNAWDKMEKLLNKHMPEIQAQIEKAPAGESQPTPAQPATPSSTRIPVSVGVSEGLLVKQVPPIYPPLARQARIQGTVVLQAIIDKDGSVKNLQLVSGHPMLGECGDGRSNAVAI